ncbi:MAG: hypothetical protein MK081_12510 [Flavobacteriales bacterium]|nr:hypothetical protein [Flavobacteriales bacterium]
MKNLVLVILLAFGGNAYASEPATSSSFEAFIQLFKEVDLQKNNSLTTAFFTDSVRWERDDGRVDYLTVAEVFECLDEFGSPEQILEGLASGFVFTGSEVDRTFVSIHNQLRYGELLTVEANALRLRKLPSKESATICILQDGIYAGNISSNKASLTDGAGIEWKPVELHHPELGSVQGYLAASYFTISNAGLPKGMEVKMIDGQWKITGFVQL